MFAAGSHFHPLNSPAQQRALWICVIASILLHAAVLFLVPGLREGARSSPAVQVLTARLGPRSSAPLPPLEVPQPRPEPQVQKPQPPQTPRPDAPRPVLTAPANTPAPAAPVVAPAPPPTPSAPPVAASPAPASAPRTAEPAAAPPAAVATAPAGAPSDSADTGSLDRYRIDLITTATRYYKRYPSEAMEKGWQGRVEVRLEIGANGMIKASSVRKGSGYPILDSVALDMIVKAKTRLITVPPALRGKEFVVDVPVIFDLKNG